IVVLTHQPSGAVTLAGFARDPTHQSFGLIQGPIDSTETLQQAGRRTVRSEIPSLARVNRHEPHRVDWDAGVYLGSAENPYARSGIPKTLHGIVFPVFSPSLVVNPEECHSGFWVYDPDTFAAV